MGRLFPLNDAHLHPIAVEVVVVFHDGLNGEGSLFFDGAMGTLKQDKGSGSTLSMMHRIT